jgi:hypothetical protein
MSAAVIAMRLRLALLRHKMPVDVDLLLSDAAYAQEVLALCKDVGDPGLIALAESVAGSRPEAAPRVSGAEPAPPPAPAPAPAGNPRESNPQEPDAAPARRYLRGAR